MNKLFNGSSPGSNNLTGIHQGETATENILVGVIYISISLFYLGPYVMCMVLIYTDKKLISKPYYLIVVNMGLTDIIQLLFNGMTAGIFTLFADLITFWMNKFVGGLMNFCWVMYCFLAHLLALNRFVNLFWPMHVNLVFSLRNTKILIVLIWIYGLSWFTAYMCPDFNLIYLPETYNWDYDETKSSRIGWLVELINDSFHAVSMVIWYTLIFIKLKFRVHMNGTHHLEDKKEFKVLLQSFLVCLMVILTIVGFFAVPAVDNKWATFSSNLIWLACAGNNAVVYYVFNSSIRKKAIDIIRCKKITVANNMLTGAAVFQISRIEDRRKSQVDENENEICDTPIKKSTNITQDTSTSYPQDDRSKSIVERYSKRRASSLLPSLPVMTIHPFFNDQNFGSNEFS